MSLTVSATSVGFVIAFRYNPALVAAVKALPGRRFNPQSKQWTAPLSSAPAVARFAKRHRAEIYPTAQVHLRQYLVEDEAPAFPPTAEQAAVISVAEAGGDLKVPAYAGAGKTSTLKLVGKALVKQGKRGAYFVFGKANADEASEEFPKEIECRTTHSFASRVLNASRRFRAKLDGKLFPSQIAELLNLPELAFGKDRRHLVFAIQSTVRGYCNSADLVVGPQHVQAKDLALYDVVPDNAVDPEAVRRGLQQTKQRFIAFCVEQAAKLWALQIDEQRKDVAMSHDHYLKLWHLSGELLNVDFILVDESQDLNPVTLAIIEAHRCQKIWVGDTHQQMFAFRGAVNAMESVNAPEQFITQSFRWGESVAEVANAILALKGPLAHPVRGLAKRTTVVAPVEDDQRHTMVFRGNAALFSAALDAVQQRKSICVVGGLSDAISMLETAYYLKQGNLDALPSSKQHADIKGFVSWEELLAAAEEDRALEQVAQRVEKYDDALPGLIAELRRAGEVDESEAQVVLTTAHKAKGREWPVVKLGPDYCSHLQYIRKGEALRTEEINILYVAATRATEHLELNHAAEELLDPAEVAEAFEAGRAA